MTKFKELFEAKPDVLVTFKKIKDFNLKALKGYARKVGAPTDFKHEEIALDEIMGYLYTDEWLQDVMDAGLVEARDTKNNE